MAKKRNFTDLDVYSSSGGYEDYQTNFYTSRSLNNGGQQVVRHSAPAEENTMFTLKVTKKGKLMLVISLVLIILLGVVGIVAYNMIIGSSEIIIKDTEVIKELGDEVVISRDLILNTDAMNPFIRDQVQLDTPLTVDSRYDYSKETQTVQSKGKGYLEEGSYPIIARLGSQEKTVLLTVKDTIAPKITGLPEEITIEQNAQKVSLEDYFSATDFTQVKTKITGDYSLKKAGTYKVKISAEDEAGNANSQDITIHVISSKEVVKTKGKNLSLTIAGYTPVSEATEKLIVTGKLKGITNPTGYEGLEVKKGQYTNPVLQAKEEVRKAEAEAKKAKEEAKKHQQSNQNTNQNTNQNINQSKPVQTPQVTPNQNNPVQQQQQKPQNSLPAGTPLPITDGTYVDKNGVRHPDRFTTFDEATQAMNRYSAKYPNSTCAMTPMYDATNHADGLQIACTAN